MSAGLATENEEKEVPEQNGKNGEGGNETWEKKGMGSTAAFLSSAIGAVNAFSSDECDESRP